MSLSLVYYNHLWKPNILQELYSDFTISKEDELYYTDIVRSTILSFSKFIKNPKYKIYYYRDPNDIDIPINDICKFEQLKIQSIRKNNNRLSKGFFIPKELTKQYDVIYIFYNHIIYDCIRFFKRCLNLEKDQISFSMISDYILSTLIHENEHYNNIIWMRNILEEVVLII